MKDDLVDKTSSNQMGNLENCMLEPCNHFDKKARLSCGHNKYSEQDLRPIKPIDCEGFEVDLELVRRSGKYFLVHPITKKEVEVDKEASAISIEGNKKLKAMANKLVVRPKDIWKYILHIY